MDNQVKAFGTFSSEDGYIIRTNTYLQWGDSERSLGAVLMFNPGSARLLSQQEQDLLDLGQTVHGELKLDNTMRQLALLVQAFYPFTLNGRFYIYNLFPVQNPSMDFAKKLFKELYLSFDPLVTIPGASVEELKKHPCILLGWGCDLGSYTDEIKKQWLASIKAAGIPVLGLKGKKENDYRHPCPQLKQAQEAYLKELLAEYSFLRKRDD